MGRTLSLVMVMSLMVHLGVSPASAQADDEATRSAARMLGYSGIEAYQAGQYEVASERLEKSFQLLRVPSLGLWSARALVKLGKLVEAHARYAAVVELSDAIGDAPVQRAAKEDARQEGADLWPRIPRLTIELAGARADDVLVTLDGGSVSRNRLGLPLPIDPGRHVVVGSSGEQRSEVALSLSEGAQERAVLRFKPSERGQSQAVILFSPSSIPSPDAKAPQPAASPWPVIGWTSVGVGAAGLTTGVVTYLVGKSKYDALPPGCRDGSDCSDVAAADSYDTMRTIHTVSTIGGAVLAAAGVTVLLVARDANEQVAVSVGPAGASLLGRF